MAFTLRFFVPGIPVPKGSTKAFVVKGKAVVTADNGDRQKPWASSISYTAANHMGLHALITGAVQISLVFLMPRPKNHYGTGKNAGKLKPSFAIKRHITVPDLDKLIRCVKDALTHVVWRDDSQCCVISYAEKVYESGNGVCGVGITIKELGEV